MPNKIPNHLEQKTVQVRKETGFGSNPISVLLNESFRREDKQRQVHYSLVYHVLMKNKVIESEQQQKKKLKFFEWGHPNHLIQADLTKFNGVNILTMLDDYSRKGWSLALKNCEDDTVINGMKKLIIERFENLLTDNGCQFSQKNAAMKKYCEEWVRDKHIWTSIRHPQTMGKLSAYQKGLKRFLFHKLEISRDKKQMYDHWYNNGKYHMGIQTYPEERYSGE